MSRSDGMRGFRASVETDWTGALPAGRMQGFLSYSRELENSYGMFSVVLDEAINMRGTRPGKISAEELTLASELCRRLTDRVKELLTSLAEHCEEHGTTPSVAPLNPEAFLSRRGKRAAQKSYLLSLLPGSQRARYLRKVNELRQMVAAIGEEFCKAVRALATPSGMQEPAALWAALDQGHYDLNTCLRELIVSLKCFLRALPGEERVFLENIPAIKTAANRAARNDTDFALSVHSRAPRAIPR